MSKEGHTGEKTQYYKSNPDSYFLGSGYFHGAASDLEMSTACKVGGGCI